MKAERRLPKPAAVSGHQNNYGEPCWTKRQVDAYARQWRGAHQWALKELRVARAKLAQIAETIEGVENRCMAADGPVTPTCREITDDELRTIYRAAKQKPLARGTTDCPCCRVPLAFEVISGIRLYRVVEIGGRNARVYRARCEECQHSYEVRK